MSSTALAALQIQSTMKYLSFDEFRASAYRQIFSLPESIIFYISKNPSSSTVYQKMIQSCKYFFVKNPIIVFHCLSFVTNQWKTCFNESCRKSPQKFYNIDLDKIQFKIWVNFQLFISSFSNSSVTSSLISKLYKCDAKNLILSKQNISFKVFLFLSSKVKQCFLQECTVTYENGMDAPLENIVTNLPNLHIFECHFPENIVYDFSNTANELIKIPQFQNLRSFTIFGIKESFDMKWFFDNCLKKNNLTKFYFRYGSPVATEYKYKLQAIVDEILDQKLPRSYLPAFIGFRGQLRQVALFNLYKECFVESV